VSPAELEAAARALLARSPLPLPTPAQAKRIVAIFASVSYPSPDKERAAAQPSSGPSNGHTLPSGSRTRVGDRE
jgi:hypothetical protein